MSDILFFVVLVLEAAYFFGFGWKVGRDANEKKIANLTESAIHLVKENEVLRQTLVLAKNGKPIPLFKLLDRLEQLERFAEAAKNKEE